MFRDSAIDLLPIAMHDTSAKRRIQRIESDRRPLRLAARDTARQPVEWLPAAGTDDGQHDGKVGEPRKSTTSLPHIATAARVSHRSKRATGLRACFCALSTSATISSADRHST